YATSPGSTALDGVGRNGLYTKHLLQALDSSDSDIDKVFGLVRTGVVRDTDGAQVPWTSTSVIGSFYFDVAEDRAAMRRPVQPLATKLEAPVEQVQASYDPDQEKAFWEKIKDSRSAADYSAYLEKFAGAPHAAYARWMVQKYGGVRPAATPQVRPAAVLEPAPAQVVMAAPAPALPIPLAAASGGAPPSAGAAIRDCPQCPELVVVPGGDYVMGSGKEDKFREPDEEPAHRVRVAGPIAVGKFEVTRGQYAAFVRETAREHKPGCYSNRGGRYHKDPRATWQNPGFEQKDDDPVVCVSWDDTQAYLAWLSKKTTKAYRLLNESEWEYVARAGSRGRHHWAEADDAAICRYANVGDQSIKGFTPGMPIAPCSDGFTYTAPVGRFPANAFGVHDMLGNVWEWVEDCWNEGYSGAPDVAQARVTGSCSERVFRGGAWDSKPTLVRAAYRDRESKGDCHDNLGFRVARSLP
ncbi:MAG: SUMF1/EgtB/PvdO family nonheme iron enzyme, partial [Proteobacteria bacterium]|nr:SUMF1/EgtB/PvdO family nonheme iron enzyme [Pseudomonadota bacterium]